MPVPEVSVWGIRGLPEVKEGANLGRLIAGAIRACGLSVVEGDILVVAHKIVSKAEGQVVDLRTITPSPLAVSWAKRWEKDARIVEVVLNQARRVLRMDRGVLICETTHGFVCANAGVDASNAGREGVVLLPRDPDASADRIGAFIREEFGVKAGVVVSDTFGRPWRLGLTNVALGVSGLPPLTDYRGRADAQGRPLTASVMATADEIASAAELVMGKINRVPVALLRGLGYHEGKANGRALIRPPEEDLFR